MRPPSHGASWPYLPCIRIVIRVEGSVHLLRPIKLAALVLTGGVQLHCLLVGQARPDLCLDVRVFQANAVEEIALFVRREGGILQHMAEAFCSAGWEALRLARALRKVLGGRFADPTAAQPSAAAGCRCRGLQPLAAAPLRSRTCSVGLHHRPCVLVWLLGLGLQCKHAPFTQIMRVRRHHQKYEPLHNPSSIPKFPFGLALPPPPLPRPLPMSRHGYVRLRT